MKRLLCYTCLLLGIIPALQAQTLKITAPVSRTAAAGTSSLLAIPDSVTSNAGSLAAWLTAHTSSKTDLLRQLYGWMAHHISYDVAGMYKPEYYKDSAAAIQQPLQYRTAICQGYAALFAAVCRKSGIPAYWVSGYTHTAGKADNASHAWVIAAPEGEWYLIDPTWGAGYVLNNKYVQRTNWKWLKVAPQEAVKSHVPFDPLWQMLEHPYRQDELRDNNYTTAVSRPVFNYRDTLTAWLRAGQPEQLARSIARIERFGITNQMTTVELTQLKNMMLVYQHNQEVAIQNALVDRLNNCSSKYNGAVNDFNIYVAYKNNQFRPARTDAEIKEMIGSVASRLQQVEQELTGINSTDASLQRLRSDINEGLAQLDKRVKEEVVFVEKYVRTSKMFRKALFYKLAY